MERTEIINKVQDVCKDVFEDESIVITENTSAKDIEAWDSLNHLTLINELEEAFDIAFSLDEVNKSKNIGELVNAIMKHLAE